MGLSQYSHLGDWGLLTVWSCLPVWSVYFPVILKSCCCPVIYFPCCSGLEEILATLGLIICSVETNVPGSQLARVRLVGQVM